jgi:hypothetical protein
MDERVKFIARLLDCEAMSRPCLVETRRRALLR